MQIQLINNLGTFSSLRDVNNAYPEGGREGDYCHIGEILYVWNKYSLSWDVWEDKNTYQMIIHEGDHDVEHDQQIGGKQKVVGNALFEHDVIVEGRLIYKNLKGLDCGLFPSESELKEAYPSPTKGMWGLVGTSSPFALYECTEDGAWTLVSSDSKLIDSLDLSAYDSVKDIVNEISNNGYIFYGFAREDTNPIKPSNFRVFYITEPNEGTFVNFDGIVCKSRSALLWDNETQLWTAHTLYPKCFVGTDMIVAGAVTTEKLKDDSVTEEKIADGAVSQTKLSTDVLSLIEAAGNEIKYILFDDLDTLKTPQTDTGIYYVYSRKTDMYTQIVGILLVQTDWSACQVTQHFFSNYKMDAGDGRHVDNEATYYKRHYGVNSSIIEKDKWTDWENAITANVELKTILDDLTTNLAKETKDRTSRDEYLDTRITAEVQELNGTIDTIETSLSEGNIRFVSFSDLDTVLGANPKEVVAAIQSANGKHTLKYIVTSNESGRDVFVGYVDMFADGMRHCLTQEFTTNYLIDADGKLDGTTHNHKLHKYVRYYNINWSSATDWRGEAWAQGTWTKWNSPTEDIESNVTTLQNADKVLQTNIDDEVSARKSADETLQGSITTIKNSIGKASGIAPLNDNTMVDDAYLPKEVLEISSFVEGVDYVQQSAASIESVVYDTERNTFFGKQNTGTELKPVYKYYNNWVDRKQYCAEAEGEPYTEKIYTDGVSTYYYNGETLVCIGADNTASVDTLTASLKTEVANRQSEDAKLATSITNETSERKQKDEALQASITEINGKFLHMTESEYEALSTYDDSTYYMLTEE